MRRSTNSATVMHCNTLGITFEDVEVEALLNTMADTPANQGKLFDILGDLEDKKLID